MTTGAIDEATGYLYRFYAQWGDGRLPEAYRGIPAEDDDAASLAERAMVTFNDEQQAMLRTFLARPTDRARTARSIVMT